MRVAASDALLAIPDGTDVILTAKPGAYGKPYQVIAADVKAALKKVGVPC